MRLCINPECSGLNPCDGCTTVQNMLMAKALSVIPNSIETVSATGMGFMRSQMDAFLKCLQIERKQMLESLNKIFAQRAATTPSISVTGPEEPIAEPPVPESATVSPESIEEAAKEFVVSVAPKEQKTEKEAPKSKPRSRSSAPRKTAKDAPKKLVEGTPLPAAIVKAVQPNGSINGKQVTHG